MNNRAFIHLKGRAFIRMNSYSFVLNERYSLIPLSGAFFIPRSASFFILPFVYSLRAAIFHPSFFLLALTRPEPLSSSKCAERRTKNSPPNN